MTVRLVSSDFDFGMVGLLSLLQKVSCADTNVGDAKVRGISGGEKKRLSVACELIASPSVIFADEPTTGNLAFLPLTNSVFCLQLSECTYHLLLLILQYACVYLVPCFQ